MLLLIPLLDCLAASQRVDAVYGEFRMAYQAARDDCASPESVEGLVHAQVRLRAMLKERNRVVRAVVGPALRHARRRRAHTRSGGPRDGPASSVTWFQP
jgi:hypothetical protein